MYYSTVQSDIVSGCPSSIYFILRLDWKSIIPLIFKAQAWLYLFNMHGYWTYVRTHSDQEACQLSLSLATRVEVRTVDSQNLASWHNWTNQPNLVNLIEVSWWSGLGGREKEWEMKLLSKKGNNNILRDLTLEIVTTSCWLAGWLASLADLDRANWFGIHIESQSIFPLITVAKSISLSLFLDMLSISNEDRQIDRQPGRTACWLAD